MKSSKNPQRLKKAQTFRFYLFKKTTSELIHTLKIQFMVAQPGQTTNKKINQRLHLSITQKNIAKTPFLTPKQNRILLIIFIFFLSLILISFGGRRSPSKIPQGRKMRPNHPTMIQPQPVPPRTPRRSFAPGAVNISIPVSPVPKKSPQNSNITELCRAVLCHKCIWSPENTFLLLVNENYAQKHLILAEG